jgi:hypothetical protein
MTQGEAVSKRIKLYLCDGKGFGNSLMHAWSNFLLEKLIVAHPGKKFPLLWNHSFITAFIKITTIYHP